MNDYIGIGGRQLIKRAFRAIGLKVERYDAASPDGRRPRLAQPKQNVLLRTNLDRAIPPRPAPFVLVATNQGTLIVNRNDYNLHRGGAGYGIGFQLLESSCCEYDEVMLALWLLSKAKESRGPGVVAVDCGANIGIHTIEWGRHMHGWGDVIAIEAQERIYYSLCGNIAINNCLNVRALLAAAGAKQGEIQVPIPDYYKPASFGSLELRRSATTEFIGQDIDYREEACATVDLISIDGLKLERLDFMKVDVEGMEMDVLAGADETVKARKPTMIIEVLKSNRDELSGYLERRGYRHFPFAGNILAVHEAEPMLSRIFAADGMLTVDDR